MADNFLSFKIKSGLKNIIGKDLITDDFVAVFELVKNSFDAYAKKVTITFEDDKIVITDDGKGMDLPDINEKWLAIAYSAKRDGVEDKELTEKEFETYRDKIQAKKFFAGAKGIGRFSCDRLGSKLILTSKKATSKSKIEQIEVDWRDFEKDSKEEFIDIKVKHRTLHGVPRELKKFEHGTILEISHLNSDWNRAKKQSLKYSLEKLINPFEDNPLNGFTIFIEDEGQKEKDREEKIKRAKVNGEVKNFVFETLGLKTTQIKTEIDPQGEFITTELWDRGTMIYKVKRKNYTKPELENIKIHLFHLNRAAKRNFKNDMGIDSVYFGSIFVYKNGFRIAPYGEYGFDYFGLDSRKGQKHFGKFGTRDLIGRIEIIGENPNFKEISSRDGGLVRNEHYNALVRFLIDSTLPKLENYATQVQFTNKEDKDQEDLSALNNIKAKSALINLISTEISDPETDLVDVDTSNLDIRSTGLIENASQEDIDSLKLIASKFGKKEFQEETLQTESSLHQIKDVQKRLAEEEEARKKAEEEKRKLEEALAVEREKNTFLRATSKGLHEDAKGLVHNIKHTSKNIKSSVDSLIAKIKTGNYKEKDIYDKLQTIKFNNEKVLKIAKIITRANFKTDENSQVIDVVKYIAQYLDVYDEIFEKNYLNFNYELNDSTFVKRLSALDIALIFDDLISNSEKSGAKNILIEFFCKTPNELQIYISDDGDGVTARFVKNPEAMFELGVSEGTVDGSGIGLHAVRKTLKPMQGTIEFVGNKFKMKGATFKIVITK